MSKKLFIFSLIFICILLAITSVIKNKTRNLEKDITELNNDILILEKQLSDSQTDFVYLSSPEKLKKSISTFNHLEYTSYDFSRIFLSTNDFENHVTKEVKHLKRKK